MGRALALCLVGLALLAAQLAHSQYVAKCKTRIFNQRKDHFAFKQGQPTFQQRVLYNTDSFVKGGPIFFYFGNEADVELYVEHTGMIWENAPRFGAAVVFAEHRYYGKSRVFPNDACDMSLLTTEQALADFAIVIEVFRKELDARAVIGFGGSYGGMLGTVFKYKYPHMIDGVIAASAPVLAYQELDPPYDSNGFARVVTRDAGPACAEAVKNGLQMIEALGKSKDGRQRLSTVFRTCGSLNDLEDVSALMAMVSSAWDYMAMGDFPYPSRYVQPEGALLPGFPVKAACKRVLAHSSDHIAGLAAAADLFYNASTTRRCLFGDEQRVAPRALGRLGRSIQRNRFTHGLRGAREASKECVGNWDFQWCTEHNMPFTSGTDQDMFYPPTGPFVYEDAAKSCKDSWGVIPNKYWAKLTYGGLAGLQRSLRNVVFSNGLLDPWSAGGVTSTKGFDPSVVAVIIPNGAHHLDLMFSDKADPFDVRIARTVELVHIAKWIKQAERRQRQTGIPEVIAGDEDSTPYVATA